MDPIAVTPKLTHIALRVASIERTAAFYERYVHFKVVAQRQDPDVRVAWLGNPDVIPDFIIVLLEFPYESTEKPRFHHIGIDVSSRDEVDAAAAAAREEGILEMEPEYHGEVVGYYCIVKDPDGNFVEFSHGQKIGEALNRDS